MLDIKEEGSEVPTSQEYKELVGSLEDTPRVIKQLVSDLGERRVRERTPGKTWAIVEHVCHLRDIEKEGYTVRIKKMLNEDRPFLEDLDGDKLAVERDYINQDFDGALFDFIDARAANIQAIRDLSESQLSKSGVFGNIGPMTLAELLNKMREHDRGHINELTQLRTSLTPDL